MPIEIMPVERACIGSPLLESSHGPKEGNHAPIRKNHFNFLSGEANGTGLPFEFCARRSY